MISAALGAATAIGVFRLPETNFHRLKQLDPFAVASSYFSLLNNRGFALYAIPSALVIGSLSAFFAGSPQYMIGELGASPTEYGFYPPLAGFGFVIGGVLVRRWAGKRSPTSTMTIGLCVMLAGALMLAIPAWFGSLGKYGILISMAVHVTGLGLVMPTAVAAAMNSVQKLVGTASAMVEFMQMAVGALATFLVSLVQPLLPTASFPVLMVLFTTLGFATFLWSRQTAGVQGQEQVHVP